MQNTTHFKKHNTSQKTKHNSKNKAQFRKKTQHGLKTKHNSENKTQYRKHNTRQKSRHKTENTTQDGKHDTRQKTRLWRSRGSRSPKTFHNTNTIFIFYLFYNRSQIASKLRIKIIIYLPLQKQNHTTMLPLD